MGHSGDLDASTTWYDLLNEIHLKYSKYDVQNDRDKTFQEFEAQKPKESFKNFLGILFGDNKKKYSDYEKLKPTDSQLIELYEEVEMILKSKIEQSTNFDTFFVKGYCVKFSDFVNAEGNLKNSANIRNVVIFAMNMVFIDQNLDGVGKKLRVFIIAPTWEVITRSPYYRQIKLSGVTPLHKPSSLSNVVSNGLDGKPGLPGGPGGDFFGIARNVINGIHLQIDSSGGSGGPGDDGKVGEDGKDEVYPNIHEMDTGLRCHNDEVDRTHAILKTDTSLSMNFTLKMVEFDVKKTDRLQWSDYCKIKVYGAGATIGGDGGNGGAGGSGAYPGDITLVQLHGKADIRTYSTIGWNWIGGSGGGYGRGGRIGGYKIYEQYDTYKKWELKETVGPSGRISAHGHKGKQGNRHNNLPEKPTSNMSRFIYVFLNEYKSYAKKYLKHSILKRSLLEFSREMSQNDKLKEFYNAIGSSEDLKYISDAKVMNEVENFNVQNIWYEFLGDVYSALMKGEVKIPTKSSNTAVDVLKLSEEMPINESNVGTFLDNTYTEDFVKNKIVRKMNLTSSQLVELNKTIYLARHSQTVRELDSDTIFFKGINVKFSDFVDDKGTLVQSKYPRNLVIFALEKVIIDRDLNGIGKEMHLIIIAPEIHVIDTKVIDLSGENGKENPKLTADVGKTGKTGKSGGPGGSFYAIVDKVIDSQYLTINVKGGNGAQGQKGGNGKDGQMEIYPDTLHGSSYYEPLRCHDKLCEKDHIVILNTTLAGVRDFECKKEVHTDNYLNVYTPSWYSESNDKIIHKENGCYIELKVIAGTIGEDGKDGGSGGFGGYSGKAELISRSKFHYANIKEGEGERGKDGKGGEGGKSGKDGYGRMLFYANSSMKIDWKLIRTISSYKQKSGKWGYTGRNRRGLEESIAAKGISQPLYIFINKYKSDVRKYLQYPNLKKSLTNFLLYLNENDEVDNYYNTIAFAEELMDLEREIIMRSVISQDYIDLYIKRVEDLDNFIPFYQSIKDRILRYAEKIDNIDNKREHLQILSYAYASALSRIYNLKDYSSRSLFFDIISFLNYVNEKFKTLRNKDKKLTIQTIKQIEDYRNQTVDHFERKIQQAEDFIKSIEPQLQVVEDDLEKRTKALVVEVRADQTTTLNKIKDEQEVQRKLDELTGIRVLLGIIKIGGVAASFFGPVGTAIGGVITATASIAESAIEGTAESTQKSIEKIPGNVESLQKLANTLKDEQMKKLNETLSEYSAEVKKYKKDDLQSLTDKVEEIKKKMKESPSSEATTALQNEFIEAVNKQEEKLKEDAKKSITKKYQLPLKILEKVKIVADVGKSAADLVLSIQQHEKKQKDSADKMNKAKKELSNLKDFERRIYSEMQPAINQVQNRIESITDNLKGQSRAALVVSKFEAQKCLRDLKQGLKEFTERHKVEGIIQRDIEHLEEIMDTLISLYDFMEHYQDNKITIHFIANVMNAAVNGAQFKDAALAEAGNNLENVVISNTLLKHYQRAVDAFKQFTFPYANELETETPAKLRIDRYLDDIVDYAGKRIQLLLDEVQQQRPSGGQYHHCLQQGPFNKDIIGVGPFFVWENEEYRNTITHLLSGREITLFANVKQSPFKIDAIKFNEISLKFIATDDSLQQRLNDDLKKFALTLQHGGDSYYRYNKEIYRMTTENQTFHYHLQEVDGKQTHTGVINIEVKNGDFVLSPYTLWRVKLEPLHVYNFHHSSRRTSDGYLIQSRQKTNSHTPKLPENNLEDFKVLKPYINQIELHLEGNARYVRMDDECIDPAIHEHYDVYEKIQDQDDDPQVDSNTIPELPEGHQVFSTKNRNKRDVSNQMNQTEGGVHTEDEVHQHATNSAPSSAHSPINCMFKWLKERSTLLASSTLSAMSIPYRMMEKSVFHHEDDEYYDAPDVDEYFDAPESLNPMFVNNAKFISSRQVASGNSRMQLPQNAEDKVGTPVSSNVDGTGLLMLADLLCRSYTGEKYKQASSLCPIQQRAQQIHELKEQVFGALFDMQSLYT